MNVAGSSGLMSTTAIANQIRCGQTDIGLAIGVESMSFCKDDGSPTLADEIMAHPQAADCVMPMGWTRYVGHSLSIQC